MVAINYAWNPVFDCITKETDDAGATVAKYTQEPKLYGGLISQRRSGATSFYHYDAIGTTRELSDSGQNVTDTGVYTSFGEKAASTGTTVNPFGFIGYKGAFSNELTVLIDDHFIYYAPRLARRITTTIAGENMNSYVFAAPQATSGGDPPTSSTRPVPRTPRPNPSGECTLDAAKWDLWVRGIVNPTRQQIFDEWLSCELKKGEWWKDLPKCPCKISFLTSTNVCRNYGKVVVIGRINPDPSKWQDPKIPSFAEEELHPGVRYSMRSKSVNGHYNQCTYDSNGNLYTEPPMAGTVDFKEPGTWQHAYHDVDPIVLANYLDGGCFVYYLVPGGCKLQIPSGTNVLNYMKVRPTWHQDCPKNPVTGKDASGGNKKEQQRVKPQ